MKYVQILKLTHLRQHIEQSHSLWGEHYTVEQRFEILLERIAPRAFFLSGLVDSTGHLVASLKRYYFSLNLKGVSVPCVGLGAIYTDPASRKQGHAARLIQTVLQESRSEYHCGAAVLYSEIGESYYRKLGFVEAPAMSWTRAISNLPQGPGFAYEKAKPTDFSKLLKWYQDEACSYPIWTERTQDTWRLFRSVNEIGPEVLLFDGNEEIGYLSFSVHSKKNQLSIEEWSVPKEKRENLWATIRKIAEANKCNEVCGWHLPGRYCEIEGVAKVSPRDLEIPMVISLNSEQNLSLYDLKSAYFVSPDHF